MNKIYLISIIAFITLTGCTDRPRSEEGIIDALYWHEGDRYTAKVVSTGNVVVSHKIPPWYNDNSSTVEVIVDVPANEKSWYKCNWFHNNMSGPSNGYCEIHIHNLDEIGTADWNHGKFGSGSTTKID